MPRLSRKSSKSLSRKSLSRKSLSRKSLRGGAKKSKSKSKSKSPKASNSNITLKDSSFIVVGYCVKCKAKGQEMNNCKFFRNNNGSVRVAGVCQKCGTKMNTFMSGDKFN